MLGLIGQTDPETVAPVDDVEVRDDVALRVPDEPAPRALLNLQDVEREQVLPDREVGDVHDRGGGAAEDLDGPPLVRRQVVRDTGRRTPGCRRGAAGLADQPLRGRDGEWRERHPGHRGPGRREGTTSRAVSHGASQHDDDERPRPHPTFSHGKEGRDGSRDHSIRTHRRR
jgi:hypothetical protein